MQAGVVFDLDGTLVNSLPGIAAGLNLALESLGLATLTPESVGRLVGRGSRVLCAEALETLGIESSADAVSSLEEAFVSHYAGTWQNGTHAYDGVPELLQRLQASGYRLAVLSNKPDLLTKAITRQVFKNINFEPVWGPGPTRPRKPNPQSLLEIARQWGLEPAKICFVGDSAIDAATAINAKTQLVLVDWGYPAGADLSAYGACIAGSGEELLLAIEESLGVNAG